MHDERDRPPPIDERYRPPHYSGGYAFGGQSYPEAIFVNASNPPKEQSIKNTNIPLLMAVVAAMFLMGAAAAATRQLTGMEYAILDLGRKFDAAVQSVSHRIDRLEGQTQDRWTRTDHEFWCSRTEQINTANGWKCAESPGQKRVQNATPQGLSVPRLDGWRSTP